MPDTPSAPYKLLSTVTIKSLRGKRSQNQVNLKLGFSYNQMSKWERGQQNISWDQLRRLADVSGKNLQPVLQQSFGFYGDSDWPSLFDFLCGLRDSSKVATTLGVPGRKVVDWKSGRQIPTFEDVLRTFDCLTVNLPTFLQALVPESIAPLLEPRYEKLISEGKLTAQYPDIEWVLCCVELLQYEEENQDAIEFINQRTNLGENSIRMHLGRLYNSGLIRLKEGRYVLNDLEASPTTGVLSLDERMCIKIYLAEKAVEAMRRVGCAQDSHGRTFSHIFFNASDQAYSQIKELSMMFYEQVRNILVHDDQPKQHLGFLNLHLCNDEFLRQSKTPLAAVAGVEKKLF